MSRAIIGNNISESMLDGLYGGLEENLKEAEKEVEKEAEALELNGEFDEDTELRAYEEEKQRKLRKDK